MKLPDIVADYAKLFGGEIDLFRHDTLKRERLPIAVNWMELEWRDHPVALAMRLVVTNRKVALWLFISFLVSTLIVAPIARLFGPGLFSPVTYPVICFASGLAAYQRFSRFASFSDAAWRFILPQAFFIYLECAFSSGINRTWGVIPVLLAVFGTGYLADQINTHYVWWITANLRLKREASLRRREIWGRRFDWFGLTDEIRDLDKTARALEGEGKADEAFTLRRRAGELRELRTYPLGFLVVGYLAVLVLLGASSTLVYCAAFTVSVALAFHRPLMTVKLCRLITEVVVHAFVSWFSWDPQQVWVNSPGMFHDGLTSRFRRITQTVLCFVLLEIAFIPSIHVWGTSEFLSTGWLWEAQYEFFLNLLLPPFMLMCTLIATGARPLWLQLEAVELCEASDEIHKHGVWDANVCRLQLSANKTERGHLWLGTHAEYGYPVLIPQSLLNEHIHILGDSGSGKTSRVLAPLLTQLIRSGKSAVVIIDLKGDMALFEAARLEAKRNGRTFKYFTNVLGKASHPFNPIQQVNSASISIAQFIETLMESLRLNHGDGYGSRFFTSQSRAWLSKTVKRFPNIASFEELYAKATPEFFKNEAEMDRCREAITVIQQIAEVSALNWKPNSGVPGQPPKDAIYMPDVVAEHQVVYFFLPAIGETSTVKEIANLALYAYLTAKKAHHDRGGREQAYLFIDEVQQMASDGFKLVLRQARSFGLSLILANQSEADLMTRQTSRLLDIIRTNTQVKLYLSINDPNTIKLLEKTSGLLAYSSESGALTYRPRLTVNDIRFYGSHSDYCICWITRDSGFSAYGGDWFGMRTAHYISREEFEARDAAAWPAPTEGTMVATRIAVDGTPVEQRSGTGVQTEMFGTEQEAAQPLVVPQDSVWAKRLTEIFNRRFAEEGNRNEN